MQGAQDLAASTITLYPSEAVGQLTGRLIAVSADYIFYAVKGTLPRRTPCKVLADSSLVVSGAHQGALPTFPGAYAASMPHVKRPVSSARMRVCLALRSAKYLS